jgi:integrase/recombinase XerC
MPVQKPETTALVKRITDEDLPPEDQILEFWRARRKKSTLAEYEQDLELFREWIGAVDQRTAVKLLLQSQAKANRLLLAYANHLEAEGKATATIRRRIYGGLAAVVSVGNTLGLISWRLAVPLPRIQKSRDTKGPPDEVIAALLDHFDKDAAGTRNWGFLAVRNRAAVYLMLGNGLRRGEVLGLDIEHVDLKERTVNILGKGQIDRNKVPITPKVAEVLAAWITVRAKHGWPPTGPVFTNYLGGRLTGVGLYKVIRTAAAAAGVPNAKPHGFRHRAITQVVKEKGAASAFAFARHSNMTMTMRYVDNLAEHAREGAEVMDTAIEKLRKKENP